MPSLIKFKETNFPPVLQGFTHTENPLMVWIANKIYKMHRWLQRATYSPWKIPFEKKSLLSSSNMANLINYDILNGKHLGKCLQTLAFFLLNNSDLYINIVYAFIDEVATSINNVFVMMFHIIRPFIKHYLHFDMQWALLPRTTRR